MDDPLDFGLLLPWYKNTAETGYYEHNDGNDGDNDPDPPGRSALAWEIFIVNIDFGSLWKYLCLFCRLCCIWRHVLHTEHSLCKDLHEHLQALSAHSLVLFRFHHLKYLYTY